MSDRARAAVSTLAELVDHLADERGGTVVAFPESGQRLLHKEIPARAWGVAHELLRAGVQEGQVVGVLVGSEIDFLPAVFGVWAAGAAVTVVPVPPVPTPVERVATALAPLAARLDHLVVADGHLALADELRKRRPGLGAVRTGDCEEMPPVGISVSPESPAIVQFTSGSTARPKGVVLSHAAVLACFAATEKVGVVNSEDVLVSWVPLFHDFGLITVLLSTWLGFETHLFTPWHFIRRPRQVVEHIGAVGATLFGGPNFGYDRMADACGNGWTDGLDLRAWRLAFNGGEPVKPSTVDRFVRALEPAGLSNRTMLPVYGMAEATMSVACPQPGFAPTATWFDRESLGDRRTAVQVPNGAENGVGLVSVGGPVPGMSLRLLDDGGLEVADGQVGEIALRGPSLASGYLDDPDATAAAFRGGWLHTGDLGVRVDSRLYVAGRIKDMIIVAGRNFFAEDVEDVVRSALDTGRGRCVAFADHERERIVVAVEAEDLAGADRLSTRVRALVSSTLELGAVDVHVVSRNALPRTTSGKWQRALTARLFRSLTDARPV